MDTSSNKPRRAPDVGQRESVLIDKLYFDRTADISLIRQCYLGNGVVVVRNAIVPEQLKALRETAVRVVYARARSAGIDLPDGLDLDIAFNRMCAIDRSLGSDVYQCLRFHPEAVKLMTCQNMVGFIESFLNTSGIYYAADQMQFRIDRKSEERFALSWHQDYWYNNTSKNAITAWYSLVDVPLELGPMRFILGSHTKVAKINVNPRYKIEWNMNDLIHIADRVEEDQGVDLPVNAGDVVFLNALAIHRSGTNTCERNRWTVVTRYADLYDPEFVAKGWKSGLRTGYISILDTDPQCIINRAAIIEPPNQEMPYRTQAERQPGGGLE